MAREPMANVDNAWLRMDRPGNRMVVVGVLAFARPASYDALREVLVERLLPYRRFRQKVEVDPAGSSWVDDPDFDIDRHFVRSRLRGKGTDEQMRAHVARRVAVPLDPAHPLWQFELVENYRGSNALVSRIHHCIADGIALVKVMLSLTDGGEPPERAIAAGAVDPSAPVDVDVDAWHAILRPVTHRALQAIQLTETAVLKSLDVVSRPQQLGDYADIGQRVVLDAARIAFMTDDTRTILKGKPGAHKVVAWNEPLALREVKAVCKALGTSVNDVLLSCVSGALRRYLLDHGADVAGCEIRAMVPVNLRPVEEAAQLGNRFGLVPLLLPVGIANPLARLREVRRRMDELKGGYQAILAYALLAVVGAAPVAVQSLILDYLARKATAVMTNVAGPRRQLAFGGAPIDRIMFWVPQSGDIGMGVSILSYNEHVQFGLFVDQKLCPDPQAIADAFTPEFERLVLALGMLPPALFAQPDWDAELAERLLFGHG